MKKNAFTVVCAVFSLAVCMLLGAVFGVNGYVEHVAEKAATQPIEAGRDAVANK